MKYDPSACEALYRACKRMLSDEVTGGSAGPWQSATLSDMIRNEAYTTRVMREVLIDMEAAVKLYEDDNLQNDTSRNHHQTSGPRD